MACSVREMAERFNASVTVLNAFNPLPEYFQGPSIDDCCNSKEEPVLPYSPALLELRDLQKERLEAFSRDHFSGHELFGEDRRWRPRDGHRMGGKV